MREVSDAFLLNVAEVSGSLLGLFVVGMLFFVETGFRRLERRAGEVVQAYFRASTRIVLLLFVIPLGLSMTLVVLELGWSTALFAFLSVALVAANLDTLRLVRQAQRATGSRMMLVNEVAGSVAVAVLVLLPWLLGGLDPSRGDLTWAILLSFGAAIASVFVLVLSVFDIGREAPRPDGSGSRG